MTEAFVKIVEDFKGKVTKTESWGLRALAYRINKNRKGHYVLLNIDAPAEAIVELDRNMHISEDVLRHLVVKVEKLEDGTSAIMSNKGEANERSEKPRYQKRDFDASDDRKSKGFNKKRPTTKKRDEE